MTTAKRVLVLGGRGFIGRYAVRSLVEAGASVTIGTRSPGGSQRGACEPQIPEERFRLHKALAKEDWQDVAGRFDVILNCVGILRQRPGETYADVHHKAPAAIAAACEGTNTRFVHVSALGLSAEAKSRFLSSKFFGERAIIESDANWALARISLLDGEGGYGAAWMRGVAALPLFVTPGSAKGDIAPLTVENAGEALCRLCMASDEALNFGNSREFELGGERLFTFASYVQALGLAHHNRKPRAITVPGFLARLGAHLCDVFHFSPFSFGHWELLCHDNVPVPNRLAELLQRTPEPVVEP